MSKHYIDNKKFEQCIIDYKQDPKLFENELVEFFDLLIHNIYKTWKFQIDFDDAKQECFMVVLKAIYNFNPEKSIAFNYFTTVIINTLRSYYGKEKKYADKLNEYLEKVTEDLDYDPSQI